MGSSRKGTILRCCFGLYTLLRTIRVKTGCAARTIRDSMGSGRGILSLFVGMGVHIVVTLWDTPPLNLMVTTQKNY